MKTRRVAVINFTRAGDLVQSMRMLARLKSHYSDQELILVTFPAFMEMAQHLPAVDTVISFDADRILGSLQGRSENLGIAMHTAREFLSDERLQDIDILHNMSHTKQSALLCKALNSHETYGLCATTANAFSCRGRWYQYLLATIRNRNLNAFNLVDIFSECSGVPICADENLGLLIGERDEHEAEELLSRINLDRRRPYVIIIPGASAENRRWATDKFAFVVKQLNRLNFSSIIIGSDSETKLGADVEKLSGGLAHSLCGKTDVGSLIAIIKRAHLVIGNDTGPLHIAAAMGVPTLGLYIGPAAAKDTAPYGVGHTVFQSSAAHSCEYRQECGTCECRNTIDEHSVAEAAIEMLMQKSVKRASSNNSVKFVTTFDDAGNLVAISDDKRHAEQTAQQELQRSFWRFVLNERQSKQRRDVSSVSQYPEMRHTLKAKVGEILQSVMRDPRSLAKGIALHVLSEVEDHTDLAAALAEFMQMRLSLTPHRHEDFLLHLDESFRMLERAAMWSNVITRREAVLNASH